MTYSLDALAEKMQLSNAHAARVLGLSGTTMRRVRQVGFSADQADRFACKAGFHPLVVWPHWDLEGRDIELYDTLREWWVPLREARMDRIEAWFQARTAEWEKAA